MKDVYKGIRLPVFFLTVLTLVFQGLAVFLSADITLNELYLVGVTLMICIFVMIGKGKMRAFILIPLLMLIGLRGLLFAEKAGLDPNTWTTVQIFDLIPLGILALGWILLLFMLLFNWRIGFLFNTLMCVTIFDIISSYAIAMIFILPSQMGSGIRLLHNIRIITTGGLDILAEAMFLIIYMIIAGAESRKPKILCRCSACGEPNDHRTGFCNHCGKPLAEEDGEDEPDDETEED